MTEVAMDTDPSWLEKDDLSGEEEEKETETEQMVINPKSVRERIDADLTVLGDFSNRPDKTTSRSDVLQSLAAGLTEYYGYIPDLVQLLLDLFSPAECVEYMDASDRPRPLVIRANTLKVTRKDLMEVLGKRGVNLEAVEWSKVAIKVTESTVPIGATPEYLAGQYMLQAAASLNPVMALQPEPGERVLDMSSAPGGKTSYIAQLMKNSGTVVANDLKPQRQKATVANLHRMGVKNAIVCCYDGRKIPKVMKGFDRVLLDAPCSGLGIISRDQSVKLQRTLKDVQRLAHLQKELLLAAIDATNPDSKKGGVIVYSTCSISNEENEQVVQYALQKRHVRLVDTGLAVGRPGYTRYKERRFHPSLKLTRRFYPHVHNMDGFFVAKFKKFANGPRSGVLGDESEAEEEDDEGSVSEEMLSGEENDDERIVNEVVEEEEMPPKSKSKRKQAAPVSSSKTQTGEARPDPSQAQQDKSKPSKRKASVLDKALSGKEKAKTVVKSDEKTEETVKEVTNMQESSKKSTKKSDKKTEKALEVTSTQETPKKSTKKSDKKSKVDETTASSVVEAPPRVSVPVPQEEEVDEEIFSPTRTPKKRRHSIQNLRSAAKLAKKNKK